MRRAVTHGCRLPVLLTLAGLVLAVPAAAQHHDHHGARDLRPVDPAEVGLSVVRLERLEAGMQRMVDDGLVTGIVTMLARHGNVAFVDTAGVQELESETPMAADTIFRIFSMTKPVTGVALMMLYEEGKWRLNDPVSMHIPEFANLKVHTGEFAGVSPILEGADREMTMRDLMTHSSGLAYTLNPNDPVSRLYRDNRVLDVNEPLQTMIDKLSGLPLRRYA